MMIHDASHLPKPTTHELEGNFIQSNQNILLVSKAGHLRDALHCLVNTLPVAKRVLIAESGLLALKTLGCISKPGSSIAVLVTGGLPEGEAIELVHQIKQRFPATLCMVLAEKYYQFDQALHAGADRVLPSRASSVEFLTALSDLCQ